MTYSHTPREEETRPLLSALVTSSAIREINSMDQPSRDNDGHIVKNASQGPLQQNEEGSEEPPAAGNDRFQRLGWIRLTVIMIVEAIALGSLSLPLAFADLGMVAGIILCISIGLVAIYAGYIIGQTKLQYPQIAHYADVGKFLFGKFGSSVFAGSFVGLLTLVVGSHCLTGAIAFKTITESGVCSTVFAVISAIILFLLAIPPFFADIAILGYIDFFSIVVAIFTTMVATGIQRPDHPELTSSDGTYIPWSAWPRQNLTFSQAVVSTNSIAFAFSFAGCLPSFMEDMHTPADFEKALYWAGGIQVVIYTLAGAILYALVGQTVQSPALLSAGPVVSRVVFGLALPVIFISGSINTVIVGRYIHAKVYHNSVKRFINTASGWISWLVLISIITAVGFVIAEAIPIFSELLSIATSLFVSGLSFYFPPVMWFVLLKEGAWHDRRNWKSAICNALVFLVGIFLLVCGTYSSIDNLVSPDPLLRYDLA